MWSRTFLKAYLARVSNAMGKAVSRTSSCTTQILSSAAKRGVRAQSYLSQAFRFRAALLELSGSVHNLLVKGANG